MRLCALKLQSLSRFRKAAAIDNANEYLHCLEAVHSPTNS